MLRQQAGEEEPRTDESDVKATKGPPPLVIECHRVEPDPRQSLQFIGLSITNTSSKAISRIGMRLNYFDSTGRKLKDWTTRRELDAPLPPHTAIELDHPAYHAFDHKDGEGGVVDAHFADGRDWLP